MHPIPLASSLSRVHQSRIRELADIAFTREGVLNLHFGESNVPTPDYIKDAATQAMEEGFTYYTENAGLPGLRKAIVQKYGELHQVDLDPTEEILITASGVQALNVAIRCVIDPGDEAIVLTPNWPNASAIISMFGGYPREIPFSGGETGFFIDFDELEATISSNTKLLAYASPSNPLGWVATVEDQHKLLEFSRRHGLWLLADEVYERIYFEGPVSPSILRICDRQDAVIVVQSFSKSYCMTGWRLGWVVSRKDLVGRATHLNEFIVSHAPAMVQRAGEIALSHDENASDGVRPMVADLKKGVSFAYEALRSLENVSLPRPDGAFYLFPRIRNLSDSFSFVVDLLETRNVAVAPGAAFGNGGEGAIRLCCAADTSVLTPAVERICEFLDSYDSTIKGSEK